MACGYRSDSELCHITQEKWRECPQAAVDQAIGSQHGGKLHDVCRQVLAELQALDHCVGIMLAGCGVENAQGMPRVWDTVTSASGCALAHAAAALGCADVLAQLLALGADVTRPCRYGTPLDIARREVAVGGPTTASHWRRCVEVLESHAAGAERACSAPIIKQSKWHDDAGGCPSPVSADAGAGVTASSTHLCDAHGGASDQRLAHVHGNVRPRNFMAAATSCTSVAPIAVRSSVDTMDPRSCPDREVSARTNTASAPEAGVDMRGVSTHEAVRAGAVVVDARFGAQVWNVLAQQLPGRSGEQCWQRWFNRLSPAVQ